MKLLDTLTTVLSSDDLSLRPLWGALPQRMTSGQLQWDSWGGMPQGGSPLFSPGGSAFLNLVCLHPDLLGSPSNSFLSSVSVPNTALTVLVKMTDTWGKKNRNGQEDLILSQGGRNVFVGAQSPQVLRCGSCVFGSSWTPGGVTVVGLVVFHVTSLPPLSFPTPPY